MRLLSEKNLDSIICMKTIIKLVNNKNTLKEMGRKAKSMSKSNAKELITTKIIELATA